MDWIDAIASSNQRRGYRERASVQSHTSRNVIESVKVTCPSDMHRELGHKNRNSIKVPGTARF